MKRLYILDPVLLNWWMVSGWWWIKKLQ